MEYTDNVNKNLMYKIFTGEASMEEKKQWDENFSKELTQKLKECCDMGYNLASEMDTSSKETVLEKILFELQELNKKIDILLKK